MAKRTLPLIEYPPSAHQKPSTGRAYDETREDILHALLALGYEKEEATTALKNIPFGVTVADGIKLALITL